MADAQRPAPGAGRLARNYIVLSAAQVAAKVLTFCAFTWLGRTLGPGRYGGLEFALAAAAVFELTLRMGSTHYAARETAKRPERSRALLGEIIELQLVAGAASFAAMALLAWAVPRSAEVKELIVLCGAGLLGVPWLTDWFFQGHDKMHWAALSLISRWSVFGVLTLAFVRPGAALLPVGIFHVAAIWSAALLSLWLVRTQMGIPIPRLRFRGDRLREHFREALPIGLSDLGWALQWFGPMLLLGFLAADREMGWFGAGHRAVMAIYSFVWLYFYNLLPSISRCVGGPAERLQSLVRGSLAVSSWAGLFVALTLSVAADELFTLAYGAEFAGSSAPFALLIWLVPLSLVSGHYRYTLIAYGFQRSLCLWALSGAAATLVWAALLIPRFSVAGAAAAPVLGEMMILGMYCWTVSRRVARIGFLSCLAAPGAACLLGLAAAAALPDATGWQRAATAGAAYVLVFVVWNRRDLPDWGRQLSDALSSRKRAGEAGAK